MTRPLHMLSDLLDWGARTWRRHDALIAAALVALLLALGLSLVGPVSNEDRTIVDPPPSGSTAPASLARVEAGADTQGDG